MSGEQLPKNQLVTSLRELAEDVREGLSRKRTYADGSYDSVVSINSKFAPILEQAANALLEVPPASSNQVREAMEAAHKYIFSMRWKEDGRDYAQAQQICTMLTQDIWAQPEAAQPQPAPASEDARDALLKALELLRDGAYLTYIKISQTDLCKGADWYLENGKFTRERLNAHTSAHEWLGKHRAYAQVLEMVNGRAAATKLDAHSQNTGHGHVFPRPDGVRARCGGPGLCSECARDLARKNQGKTA